MPGTAHAHQTLNQGGQFRIAVENSGQYRQRSEHKDGHLLGMGTHLLGNHFVARQLVVQLGTRQIHISQTVGSVQAGGIAFVLDRQGGAKPRPTRRIHLFHHGLHIAGRLFGRHIAGAGRDSQ